jgi:hypothetical protein
MRIGPSELLIVAIIIIIMIALSRARKSSQEAKERAEAERLAKLRAGTAASKSTIKYPQLQLLGVLVMLAGAAMAILAYLNEQEILGTLSIAGIGVLIVGIAFIILARRR